jgi:hypothetical protein
VPVAYKINIYKASVEPDDQQLPSTPATASPIHDTSTRPGQLSQQLSPPTSNSLNAYDAPSPGGTPALSRKRAQQNIYEGEEGESGSSGPSHEERYKGQSSSKSPTYVHPTISIHNRAMLTGTVMASTH